MAYVLTRGRPKPGRIDGVRAAGAVRFLPPIVSLLLFVVALGLRVYRMTGEPLWLDEGYTLLFSRMPLQRLLTVGGEHEHPPLYYLMVHAVLAAHNSTMVPRALSALFGSLTVIALFYLGKTLYGTIAGAIAGALLAVAPLHVFYGQDGRGYELAGLLVVLAYLTLFRASQTGNRALWAAYALLCALCLYTEYITAFALAPQVILLGRAWKAGQRRAVLLSLGGAALLFLPWMGVLAHDASSVAGDYWIPAPNPTIVADTFLEFVGLVTACSASPCQGHEVVSALSGNEVIVASVLVACALAVGLVAAWRRSVDTAVLVLWLLFPFTAILIIGIARPLYLDRVFLDASFPVYLLLAGGLARLRWTALPAGIVVALMCVVAPSQLANVYAGGYNPDWRSLSRDLAAAYRPGQSVFINPGVVQSILAAYLPANWHPTREVPLWSRVYVDVPGWQQRFPTPPNSTHLERNAIDAELRSYQLGIATRGEKQMWLVTYDYSGMNDTRRWLVDHGFEPIISELYGGDTRLELWDRRTASALGPAIVPDNGLRTGWSFHGAVRRYGNVMRVSGSTQISRTFPVTAGETISVATDYRGEPPASKPVVRLVLFDAAGHSIATFPRTMWYDWPVMGVWLSQPFGFVAPPGSTRATLTLSTAWGQAAWRHVAVYRER